MGRTDIDAAIVGLSEDSRWRTRAELQRLSGHLQADEDVRALARGLNLGSDGLVVVTDDRIIFFDADEESESEISFRRDEVASVEFRAERVKLLRMHDPTREGIGERLRRFFNDTPLVLELSVPDEAELSGLYEALVLGKVPLKDRTLLLDGWTPVGRRTEPISSGALGSIEHAALRRWWAVAGTEVRSGSLPLLAAGWAVSLATIAVGALAIEETTNGEVTSCSWNAPAWVLAAILLGPPVAVGLVRLGARRSRTEQFGGFGCSSYGFIALVSLFVYGAALWHLTGRPLC